MTLKEKLQHSQMATSELKDIAEKNYHVRAKLYEVLVRLHSKLERLKNDKIC